jgi:GNAT superfamily N-acetyltransferase
MSGGDLFVRPLQSDERAAWEPLWTDYLAFYKTTVVPEVMDAAWRRMHDPAEPMFGLGAYSDGAMIGIVHYLFHRSFWSIANYCYLQDLFVAEAARGKGAGRALIEAVEKAAREAGAGRVHWLTQENNSTARALYDTLADCPGFIQYRKIF